jgi:iron complex transport system substrate-binding protein
MGNPHKKKPAFPALWVFLFLFLPADLSHAAPQRLVSLAPNLTEILFALGLDREIAGVTEYCNFPEEARRKPKVGGMINPSLESIVRMNPDAVFAVKGFNPPETLSGLKRLGIPVHILSFASLEEVFSGIREMGRITGRSTEADGIVFRMESRLKDLVRAPASSRRPRVLYVVSEHPPLSAGPGSFIHDVIERAGGRNLMEDARTSYPFFNLEEVMARNPEVIFFSSEIGEPAEALLARWKRWNRIEAVASGRVFEFNSDLINRPGPRIVEAIEIMARMLNHVPAQP